MDNEETIEELRAALAELESGEGLSRFVEGHGLQSRFFAFSWKSEGLSIDFNLPCGRVLLDEEEQALDAARVGAALRMAILLLTAADGGKLYNRLVAMESGKERDDYIASLRARLAEDQVEVAILRLDGAIAHAKALKERGCVVSTADWEKRDVQRKVAGQPQAPLPSYKGSNKACIEYANNAQRSVNRAVCPFRRDLLTAIAKPG